MAEQRTNDQISPKSGEEFTPEVLSKMSLEELEVVRKEISKRLKQRGSSRPVTHANNWLDNKKNERDYLNLVRGAISDKLQEGVLTFSDFIKEDVTEGEVLPNVGENYTIEDMEAAFEQGGLFGVYKHRIFHEGYVGSVLDSKDFNEWISEYKS